jgi:DNA repair exonuclease SbcCD nuclease subunit
MSNWPFRFLHAADFHLELPPSGLVEIPESLTDLFLEAAYRSAERVFDVALAENVDFVVLSGNLLNNQQTGPRGPLFLVEQFERLAEQNIMVYWAGGKLDAPEAWPPSIRLPKNVSVFGQGDPEQCVHRRSDTPVARLIGASRLAKGRIKPKRFEPEHAGVFCIAVAHGHADVESLKASRVDYWALGGSITRQTFCEIMPVIHYPGSPQGRQPGEAGPHGCTLVDVDLERNTQLTLVPTDVIRWDRQTIAVTEDQDVETLEQTMAERVESLTHASPDIDFVVSWQATGSGPLVDELRSGTLSGELLGRLRERFGRSRPAVWSASLSVAPPARYPAAWGEEDTIRGEFLRQIDRYRRSPAESFDLEAFLPKTADGALADLVLDTPESSRDALLRETAALGVDLLFGEENES